MRLGDCKVCRRKDAAGLVKAKSSGESTRSIGRRLGIPEATLRRHFEGCRREQKEPERPPGPVPTPAQEPAPDPPIFPEVRFAALKAAAAQLGLPFGGLLLCVYEHLEADVIVDSEEEREEMLCLLEAAQEDEVWCAAVARSLG